MKYRDLVGLIDDYLAARLSVRELEGHLIGSLQSVLDSRDDAAIDLANRIDVDLMALSDGLIDEAAFGEHMRAHRRGHLVVTPAGETPIHRPPTSVVTAGADDALVGFGEEPQNVVVNAEVAFAA